MENNVGSHNGSKKNYFGSGTVLQKAKLKHKKENFEKEILQECESIDDARRLEEPFIKKYKTLVPNGYNIHPKGGSNFKGSIGLKHSKETKEKISNSKKGHVYQIGEKNSMFGKHHSKESKKLIGLKSSQKIMSEEAKQKISLGNLGEKNGIFGTKRSSITKEKIRNKLLGRTLSVERIEKMKTKYKCKYCGREMNKSNLTRYHNENCKKK